MNPNNNLQFDQDKFIENKYLNRYKKFCFKIQKLNRQRIIKDSSLENHHIVPESFGGNNSKENRVMFTVKEHLYAHYLLKECTIGIWRSKMVFAFHRMIHGNKGFRKWINSTFYIENKKELSSLRSGRSRYINENGEIFYLHNTDEKIKRENLISVAKGKITVKDENGRHMRVDLKDPRYLSGELVHMNSGKISSKSTLEKLKNRLVVKDKIGNIYSVFKNDPRYLSGELVSINIGKVMCKDKYGNNFSVHKNDPRYLNGELIHISVGVAPWNKGMTKQQEKEYREKLKQKDVS